MRPFILKICDAMTRLQLAFQTVLIFLGRATWTNPIIAHLDIDPADSAASVTPLNSTDWTSQTNMLDARSSLELITTRQASCPNPSTDSLCQSNFCFIYEQHNDGSAWATCCPVGWSLQLNSADWSTQKCVLQGVSEPPIRPVSCGGSINGSPGTISGWACVYSNGIVNGVAARREQSNLLILALSCAWFGSWLF